MGSSHDVWRYRELQPSWDTWQSPALTCLASVAFAPTLRPPPTFQPHFAHISALKVLQKAPFMLAVVKIRSIGSRGVNRGCVWCEVVTDMASRHDKTE